MSQKSYDDSPTLYLIPTPIGNMEDITLRAIKTIEMVDFLLTEDTRVTGLLLSHFKIKKRMVANHKFNEESNRKLVLSALKEGKNIGLVSDRGTPVISDPGYEIAKFVLKQGYNVVGLPGATALIPALIVSGITPMPFIYYGFLNSKTSQRNKELELLKNNKMTMIFYEAPHRLKKTLESMKDIFGNRNISISREISKKYEEVYRGTIKEVLEEVTDVKGELVIIVEGNKEVEEYTNDIIREMIEVLISDGKTSMEAIKEVTKTTKKPKGEIYSLYHK